MLIKTRGIIFKAKKYSETSVIVDVFTEEKGLRSYIVSGVRSKRPTVSAGLLQPMTAVDLVAYHREDQDLTRLKEIRPHHVFQSIPFDIRRSSVGLFMVEVARNTVHGHEANEALFDFLLRNFVFLDETTHPIANLHLHFMIHLTEFMGFLPSGDFEQDSHFFDLQEGVFIHEKPMHNYWLAEVASAKFYQLLMLSMDRCHEVPFEREERRSFLKNLLLYYRLHIDNFPTVHSHEVLEEVLGG
ncbi:MAG: DNA repair protein RecO [Saprospiraceae bacterium]|nr:DNA repair protein RecO [Saprospiraceae bacterium]MCF8250121.1 DNA repair protein RecO [Saprospiraceae bacterium]MCF8279385.1 DNA repair protein RecO [Bacteroidales bacterium]MCF8311175.1 DNA repair protein RecO [Saprospiraceae bacterium]MCF8440444.1 DNA repair protein RecO [Saprospiraceae bacterium]